ncbi:unnamed protein product, partial [Meganyctiphanes norvegica]
DMERRMLAFVFVGILLVLSTIIGIALAILLSKAAPKYNPHGCPAEYGFNPVLIVSLDGFRADYLERGLTPNIQALADMGVYAPFMKPSYPSITFPNHYTIVTGTYPETHGIIANSFYDPKFKKKFSYTKPIAREGRWWGAQPIWNTVNSQGGKSATYFWPGSGADIDGTHPNYWFPYNGSVSFEDRVDQVLDWVAMDYSERPSFISLYFNEPDHTGHDKGPESPEVNDQLMHVDGMIQRLTQGLMDQGHAGCVNIIIIADHGMATSGDGTSFKMTDYIANISDAAYTYPGAFSRINPKNKDPEVKFGMLEKLVCQEAMMRAYDREGLPTRFHFSNNPRIEDIVMDLEPGYSMDINTSDWSLNGQHGYDNYATVMNALFLAVGPAFQEALEVEPFQNIELYNLMCHLAGVDPAPNNGTQGSLDHILKSPPPRDPLTEENKPPTAEFPSKEELSNRLGISGCPGDLQVSEDWIYSLDVSEALQSELEQYHLPWGIPHSGDLPADLNLLHHGDYVTGYSSTLRMPLWTSFTISRSAQEVSVSEWSSDPRLTKDNTPSCASYDALKNVSMGPLFPHGHSKNSSLERVPYLVSNAVPMTSQVSMKWQELLVTKLNSWVMNYGGVNVVAGPIFDNNADSHPDDFTGIGETPEVPSDLFVVMTRCKTHASPKMCPPSQLDAQAFIYPLEQRVPNCMEPAEYMLMFSSKVRDVELATGLDLYPNLEVHDRVRLLVRIHDTLWE